MNTLIVDDSATAALDYFQSSFAPPVYDARMTDTYYETFFPVSGVKVCAAMICLSLFDF